MHNLPDWAGIVGKIKKIVFPKHGGKVAFFMFVTSIPNGATVVKDTGLLNGLYQ